MYCNITYTHIHLIIHIWDCLKIVYAKKMIVQDPMLVMFEDAQFSGTFKPYTIYIYIFTYIHIVLHYFILIHIVLYYIVSYYKYIVCMYVCNVMKCNVCMYVYVRYYILFWYFSTLNKFTFIVYH